MILRRLALLLSASLPLAAASCEEKAEGDAVAVPSGRDVRLIDVITNAPGAEGATARFRFLVPGLQAGSAPDWAEDMQALCDNYALDRIDVMVPAPQQIIISLADTVVPFGEAAPEAVQFFEAYAPKDGICIWEMF